MPLRYLFEPWKAPLPVQQKAKCIVGVDYPRPMVDHQMASKDCMKNMKAVKDALMGKGMNFMVHVNKYLLACKNKCAAKASEYLKKDTILSGFHNK